MKILVFNISLSGHFLEYFHHLYMEAVNRHEIKFVFAYPTEDENQLSKMEWPKTDNVELLAVNDLNIKTNNIRRSYLLSKSLGRMVKQIQPDRVILIDFVSFLPFLPLFVHRTKVYGIRYGIYLYTWKSDKFAKRCADVLKNIIIKRSKVISKIFVQADHASAVYLNRLYKTNKFDYICDPVVSINNENVHNLRKELNIPDDKILVLHAGDMSNRKGSLCYLKGLEECPTEVLNRYYFVFAGRVNKQIESRFYEIYKRVCLKTNNIYLETGFLSFERLGSLIYSCDILFLPYLLTDQSSGFVGYASEFKKPAVVINSGLLSKIVRKYKLGYIIPDASPSSITNFFRSFDKWIPMPNTYFEENSINEFVNTMFK